MSELHIWGDQDSNYSPEVLKRLHRLNLPVDFSIVDIACGRGVVLRDVKAQYPESNVLGVDIAKYPEWDDLDVRFIQMPLQEFIKKPSRWDVVLMLNTYHNWEGADKVMFDKWVKNHASYFVTL